VSVHLSKAAAPFALNRARVRVAARRSVGRRPSSLDRPCRSAHPSRPGEPSIIALRQRRTPRHTAILGEARIPFSRSFLVALFGP
jgi:hypothetical protein